MYCGRFVTGLEVAIGSTAGPLNPRLLYTMGTVVLKILCVLVFLFKYHRWA